MPNEPVKNENKSGNLIYAVVAVLALLLIVWVAQKNTAPKTPQVAATNNANPDGIRALARPNPTDVDTNVDHGDEPKENGARAYLVEDFTDPNKSYDKYKMDGIQVTPKGLMLAAGKDKGTIESPTMPLKMPSSTTAFLWKQEVPRGSGVRIEVSLSPDNQVWSPWYAVNDMGDDINPLYPDGSPNPNYGFVPGSYVSLGLNVVPYIRYRMVLMKQCDGCPEYRRADGAFPEQLVVSGARIWHYNGAGAEGGQLANASNFPPPDPTPEELKKMQEAQKNNNAQNTQKASPTPSSDTKQ